jgi:DNA-binding winged helix-turn-helix (wHTH) protein/TolB-like protein/Tfp pilus assembly protein PilF
VRFGPFELDQATGELYRDGRRIRVQEQPRQVLVALLERPGELVTREDLRERLWKSDTFVDFERGLNTAVKKARQALGDSAEAPQFIETLARRGYRFIARVEPPEAAPDAGVPSPAGSIGTPVTSQAARWDRRPALATAAVGLAVVCAAAIWIAQRAPAAHDSWPPPHARAAQLAVMPLRVLTESAQDSAYLGVGMADAITTRLANARQIAVRPTSAVLPFKDAQSDLARIASSLGVHHLLMGTIQPGDQTIRISVQLVNAEGVAVWARQFDEPRAGLHQLQDRVAEQVVAALRVELSPPERARLHARYTRNPDAYDLYLRGRSLLVSYSEQNMREAIGYFERALGVDPEYALARAGLAVGTAWFSVRYAYETDALAWGKRADEEARRALEQDPSLADAHLAIASAAGTLYGGFDWATVLDRSAKALALDPSLDLAHVARMRALSHFGLIDEARAEARLARALNPSPNSEAARLEAAMHLFSGEFPVAAQQAAELLQRTEMPAIRQYLGLARFYTGDVAGAREMLAAATRNGHPDVRAQASLASVEAAAGLSDQARARATAIGRGSYMDHHVAYSLGAAFAQLGDVESSLRWLEQAGDTGFPCYSWFKRDRLLDPVRQQPGFVRLLARLRDAHGHARRFQLLAPGSRLPANEKLEAGSQPGGVYFR